MIKVLHISTYKTGGAGNAAYRLHLALMESNLIDTKFIYRKDEKATDGLNEKSIQPIQPQIHHLISNKLGFPILNTHKNDNLTSKINGSYEIITFPLNDFKLEEQDWVKIADIIHLHWIGDFINYPSFFKQIMNKPVIWTLHDMNPFKGLFHYQQDEVNNKLLFEDIDINIKKIKADSIKLLKNLTIVSPSKWLADKAKKSFIFHKQNIKIIPYSLPSDWFELRSKNEARKRFNLKSNINTLLFSAVDINNKRKGLDLLIEALEILSDDNIQLLVIGNKEFQFYNQQVIRTGYLSNEKDIILAYAATDVFILPSREDNLPNVMLESFAQGIPVISFKNGGMSDWILDGFNGYLCDEICSKRLAFRIKDFFHNKEKFDRKKINYFAIQNFNSNKQADAYNSIYTELINYDI